MDVIRYNYNNFFIELSDPRVHNWHFMSEPWELLAIIVTYLYGIYVFLPKYMEGRKPFSLKRIIAIYNIYQVIACSILIYGVGTSGWTTDYSVIGCYPPDYNETKQSLRMARFMWWHMILKMSELLETIFFVLRKKFNQVSGLHVYHHVSTLFMAWLILKYFCGGMLTFTVLINSFVHILMYSYYFLAALGPEMQNKLKWVKPKLTAVQLVQLVIITVHTFQVFLPGCSCPKTAAVIYLPNMAINIYMFVKFYINSYLSKSKSF